MPFELPKLPYAVDALEPHVSSRTLEFHYGKHHRAYVDKLNGAIKGTDYAAQSLEEIISSAREASDRGVFNNAAQAWNHAFLWHSMAPDGGGNPVGPMAEAIDAGFGDTAGFRDAFRKAALSNFGSGWTWLVQTPDGLEVMNTGNAETPLSDSVTPLLTLDVWEHAYYLDYQNKRDAYVDSFLTNLINWDFAARNFDSRRAAA